MHVVGCALTDTEFRLATKDEQRVFEKGWYIKDRVPGGSFVATPVSMVVKRGFLVRSTMSCSAFKARTVEQHSANFAISI